MILSATDKESFLASINNAYPASESVVLRYMDAFAFGDATEDRAFKRFLKETSIAEGAAVLKPIEFNNVRIFVLDETSLMHGNSLKAIDGCVTTARCRANGFDRVVFESGGNTGIALTGYGQKAGLETFLFMPRQNIHLLNGSLFENPGAHLVSVFDPAMVKKAAALFSEIDGAVHIPKTEWRYEASMFRGAFILEDILRGLKIDWFAQTISAAFGPIGIYRVLDAARSCLGSAPAFLGVQQEANCPAYRGWKNDGLKTLPENMPIKGELIAKTMYDVSPKTYGSYEELRRLLVDTGGDLTTVNRSEFDEFVERPVNGSIVIEHLAENGVAITRRNKDIAEKTGLTALAGVFKEILSGRIPAGSSVLCSLTSGVSMADGLAKPEFEVHEIKDVTEYAKRFKRLSA